MQQQVSYEDRLEPEEGGFVVRHDDDDEEDDDDEHDPWCVAVQPDQTRMAMVRIEGGVARTCTRSE